ncbi:cache domain-containing sensor histidine kinase [Paraliobacillus salinarum]|uniref:cache domain-containing sensor histidine kinase n=1 Tax=Paraliobacillus salinarum TaxID=1158996 RepID=UPI001C712727|nr:histidine kinase [Paraliobacillus salinarum]
MKKKNTLEYKMKVYFSLIFFSAIILLGLSIMHYSNEKYQEQSYQYLKQTVESNISLLDKYFSSLQNVAQIIVSDQDVRTAVAYRNQVEEIDYSIELYNHWNVDEKLQHLKMFPYVTNAVVISSNEKGIYSYKETVNENYNFGEQEWFKKMREKESASFDSFFSDYHNTDYLKNNKGKETISMVTPILNKQSFDFKNSSYLLSDVDISSILLENTRKDGAQLAITNGSEWIHLPKMEGVTNQQLEAIKRKIANDEKYFLIDSNGRKGHDLLVVRNTTNTTGWNIVGIQSLKGIQDTKITVLLFIISMIIISGLIIAIVSGVISKTILNPVNQLIGDFNKVAKGDYSVKFEDKSSEEISKISRSADNMIQNMLLLSNKVLEEQKKLSKAQIRSLQNQINPHFFNNALQSIKALSINGESDKISKLSTLLGKMLSYSVYQPYEHVALQTELEYIEHYIMIQNVRFEGKFFYSIDCDEELKNVKVPKLIIQPIIENALKHGFENRERGFLNISVEKEGEEVCILITDDGKGMEDNAVTFINGELRYKDSYSSHKSIGLLNVNQRIKSEFGEAYGLEIISKNKKGTTVIINLPYIR